MKSLDSLLEKDEAGAISRALGLGVYAGSAWKEPQLPVESVIVFGPGYYEYATASPVDQEDHGGGNPDRE